MVVFFCGNIELVSFKSTKFKTSFAKLDLNCVIYLFYQSRLILEVTAVSQNRMHAFSK
jgi:hypothetical protein